MSSPQCASALTFKDMPPEIRNLIYTFALVDERPVALPYGYEKKSFAEPALLSASHWVRQEAAAIYYGCNTFEAPSPPSAQKFLQSLRAENIAQLRSFRPMDCVLPLSAHRRWFDAVRRNINRLVNPHGKHSLNPDAVFLPICAHEQVTWKTLRDIGEFDVIGDAREWNIEWRGEPLSPLCTAATPLVNPLELVAVA